MALAEFLRNITTAAKFLSPTVASDSASVDADAVEDMLTRAALWLTPAAVNGFDPNEFWSLSAAEKEALRTSVQRFRDLASSVPADGPAPPAIVAQALAAFVDILRRTGPYTGFGRDPEEKQVWEA